MTLMSGNRELEWGLPFPGGGPLGRCYYWRNFDLAQSSPIRGAAMKMMYSIISIPLVHSVLISTMELHWTGNKRILLYGNENSDARTDAKSRLQR